MVQGCYIVYNDMPTIVESVESIYDKVDRIVAVDGRFIDFPGGDDLSTDGTREYLQSLDKVELIDAPRLDEVAKRNLYLTGADWYLHLDGDEVWVGDVVPPAEDMLIHYLMRVKPKCHMKRIRLFRHVAGLHYEGKHYWLKAGGQTYALLDRAGNAYTSKFVREVKIKHLSRTGEREQLKAKYYKVLRLRESRIKESL